MTTALLLALFLSLFSGNTTGNQDKDAQAQISVSAKIKPIITDDTGG